MKTMSNGPRVTEHADQFLRLNVAADDVQSGAKFGGNSLRQASFPDSLEGPTIIVGGLASSNLIAPCACRGAVLTAAFWPMKSLNRGAGLPIINSTSEEPFPSAKPSDPIWIVSDRAMFSRRLPRKGLAFVEGPRRPKTVSSS